jgi:hypothetical protein
MTRYTPRTVERTALPDAVDALGVDGDGRTHYTTPRTAGPITIYVETGDGFDVFDVEEMPIAGLDDWVDHVDAQRGWNRVCYVESFDDLLADTLMEAV